MEIGELITFIQVAELESFSDAADKLFLTQPAISKRIASLEANLGVKLFDRIGRKVQLTEAGERLLPKARKISNDLDDIKRSMTLQMDEISGLLRISTSHHIGLHRLPKSLKQFQNRYPNAQIDIEFTQSEDAYRKVIQGDVEIGIITLNSSPDQYVTSIPIWSDPLKCVVSNDHPLADEEQVDVLALSKYQCVLPNENTFTRQIAETVFASHQVKPNVRMNTNNLETLAMLVTIGWGWSVLPSTLVDTQLKVLDLPAFNVERKLGVIHHNQRTLSRAARAFIDMLQNEPNPR
ncbi:LysR family transcriptional regulator [Marinomonas mediterranea]|jgi:transcriptional regulator, LysR family|uniref:Transcriptional regulator, LysR family n=1 Tax=Marinomonas mediterranea (strain ATCC 700492 / JCM 21426 / NBRC 103028 / MMB-1) TaxID=717774 RepID=F2JTK4_MARM1|nr:LysR family transcriptional regulator [Marinomonas mediterranea]ADZ91518.1 transcriptional regulator, LysR family [Marinomonas mediterranea MMB-1]